MTRDELAAEDVIARARAGKSLQEYLRGMPVDATARPHTWPALTIHTPYPVPEVSPCGQRA